MKDESFTPEIIHMIWHGDTTLDGLQALTTILCSFAYHDEPLTSKDLQNMFSIIAILDNRIKRMRRGELNDDVIKS